ncbi:macro domain-containing protein [Azonexus sp.]|uniref:macro domain-containing protein n=1 Tax=Azonexus sp. TaxID=1872668 RepID=UPI0039E6DA5F
MSELKIITGNIFTTQHQTIVNTVNCVGVMGAGIALECRFRYPDMFQQYLKHCEARKIDIGILWIYKTDDRWILNFPTKKHWKYPSKEAYLHAGLKKFMDTHEAKGVRSAAFPVLGGQHGGLGVEQSIEIMESYLRHCSIPIEIYKYDPLAGDDIFDKFKERISALDLEVLKRRTGLRIDYIERIREALKNPSLRQLNQLAQVQGIGDKTLEKVFALVRDEGDLVSPSCQLGLGF